MRSLPRLLFYEGECVRRGRGQDAGVISTVEPFLIRGLDTAYGTFVGGEPRSDSRKSVTPLLKLLENPLTGADALAAASISSRSLRANRLRFDLLRDRSNEADELARDGGDDDRHLLAARQHATVAAGHAGRTNGRLSDHSAVWLTGSGLD